MIFRQIHLVARGKKLVFASLIHHKSTWIVLESDGYQTFFQYKRNDRTHRKFHRMGNVFLEREIDSRVFRYNRVLNRISVSLN